MLLVAVKRPLQVGLLRPKTSLFHLQQFSASPGCPVPLVVLLRERVLFIFGRWEFRCYFLCCPVVHFSQLLAGYFFALSARFLEPSAGSGFEGLTRRPTRTLCDEAAQRLLPRTLGVIVKVEPMIKNVPVRMALSSLTASVLLLSGCAHISSRENTFVGSLEKQQAVLSCEGRSILDTPCILKVGHHDVRQTVRFSTERTRYFHLLKKAVKNEVEGNQSVTKPHYPDAVILQSLVVDECHPDITERWSGDILQLCIPPDTSSIVLFFRGVCDRCEFKPVVLKRKIGE